MDQTEAGYVWFFFALTIRKSFARGASVSIVLMLLKFRYPRKITRQFTRGTSCSSFWASWSHQLFRPFPLNSSYDRHDFDGYELVWWWAEFISGDWFAILPNRVRIYAYGQHGIFTCKLYELFILVNCKNYARPHSCFVSINNYTSRSGSCFRLMRVQY